MSDFAAGAWSSFKYSLVQSPLTGATQLIDKVAGTHMEQNSKFFNKPEQVEFGSAGWVRSNIRRNNRLCGSIHSYESCCRSRRGCKNGNFGNLWIDVQGRNCPVFKSVAAGVAYNGVLTPVEEGEDFVGARVRNMAVGGLTWGSLTATSIGLKGLGMRSLTSKPWQKQKD